MRRPALTAALALVVAGALAAPASAVEGPRRVTLGGVHLRLPAGWSARELSGPSRGRAIVQFANVRLEGRGGVDPIKAMGRGDVVVTLVETGRHGSRLQGPLAIRSGDLLPVGRATPVGRTEARRGFCGGARCFVLGALLFGRPVPAGVLCATNRVLATVRVPARGG